MSINCWVIISRTYFDILQNHYYEMHLQLIVKHRYITDIEHLSIKTNMYGGDFLSEETSELLTKPDRQRIHCKYWLFYVVAGSELLAKPDWEPVEDLNDRDEADSKAKSADAAKAGDEVQPSHLWRPFEFWNNKFISFIGNLLQHCNWPNTVDFPKKMFTMAMSFS